MSKNIIIQEGGVGRQLTASKRKTSQVGGGTVLWVPEDERQVGNKHITANGTYAAADDGLWGYSQVTVNVAGAAGAADSAGGPSGVSGGGDTAPGGSGSAVSGYDPSTGDRTFIGVDNQGQLVTTVIPESIDITHAPDKTVYDVDEDINYTGMIVMALRRNGQVFSDSRYTTGILPLSELARSVTKATRTETPAGPQALQLPVSWTSPYDRRVLTDSCSVTVLDPDQALPASIRVTTMPTKVSYGVGETVEYTGMVVKAYKSDNTLWTDENHPEGVIPLSELTLQSVTTAMGAVTGMSAAPPEGMTLPAFWGNPIPIGTTGKATGDLGVNDFTASEGTVLTVVGYGSWSSWSINLRCFFASATQGSVATHYVNRNGPVVDYTSNTNRSFTYNEKTVLYDFADMGDIRPVRTYEPNSGILSSGGDPYVYDLNVDQAMWTMIYGDITEYSQQEIPVKWTPVGFAVALETSFDITVGRAKEDETT